MKPGDIVYHPEYGLLQVTRREYRRLGNKTAFFGKDEQGEEHELDDRVESPEKYLKERAKEEEKAQKEQEKILKEQEKEAEKHKKEEEKQSQREQAINVVLGKIQSLKGDQGEKGEKGDKGDKGDQGEKGEKGEKGDSGIDGVDGRNGADGKPGKDGKNGLPGRDGVDGKDGKDGSPDTPEQIKKKLEALSGDDRLDASAIKGLPKQELVRMGGGDSYTGQAKVDTTDTPGNLEDKIVAGTNVTITKTNGTLRISSSVIGSGGHTIQDEGTPLTSRSNLNFVGSGVTVTDDSGNDATVVTISSGGISDGDKGDITVSGSGSTFTIDNGVVTLAKQADMATASVVYRKTAGTGAPEVQTLATLKTDLGLTGTNSGDQTSIVGITGTKSQFNTALTDGDFLFSGDVTQYTDELAQDAVGGILTDSSEIDFTYNDATPSITASIVSGSIDETKLDASVNASLDLADSALQSSAIGSTVQGYDADLAAIAGLTPSNDDFLQRKAGAWTNRTPTQATADLIAFVGDSGSGGTKGLVPAPVTGDSTKFLKGDGTWGTPAGSGDVSKVGTPVNNQIGVWTGDGTLEGDTALTFDTATDTLATGIVTVTDDAYGVGWNGSTAVPTKNAIYDKIETLSSGGVSEELAIAYAVAL